MGSEVDVSSGCPGCEAVSRPQEETSTSNTYLYLRQRALLQKRPELGSAGCPGCETVSPTHIT